MKRYRSTWLSIAVVMISAIAVWHVVNHRASENIREQLHQTAFLAARSVETEINRFRYLPEIVGEDVRIATLLQEPDNFQNLEAANAYLATVAKASGAAFLYLLDKNGLTRAASNWADTDSLIGKNYGFRPYFKDAVNLGAGRYYAIGVTTGKPGYFMSRRINVGSDQDFGVVVVKIDLLPLEVSWQSAAPNVALADRYGIVFLTGNQNWKYHPLVELDSETLRKVLVARTYDGVDIANLAAIPAGDAKVVKLLPDEGWSLYTTSDLNFARQSATTWAFITILVGALLSFALHFIEQRRQLIALRLCQHDWLERKVRERTRDLAHEIEVRKVAENSLKLAQDGLIHAEKMAALGRMSAAIAHEISQPLAALETTLASANIIAQTDKKEGVTIRIESARNLVWRMQRTIKHLKSFSRKDKAEKEQIDCLRSLREALELVEPKLQNLKVKLELKLDRKAYILGSAIRLEQVFLNLLLNSLDALEGIEEPRILISQMISGGNVIIEIADNGQGIEKDVLPLVTEPFFTTKAASEGLGLGLSITAAIIEDFGGKFNLEANDMGGVTAKLIMPNIANIKQAVT